MNLYLDLSHKLNGQPLHPSTFKSSYIHSNTDNSISFRDNCDKSFSIRFEDDESDLDDEEDGDGGVDEEYDDLEEESTGGILFNDAHATEIKVGVEP